MVGETKAKILSIDHPVEDICLVRIEPVLSHKPGQFVSIIKQTPDGRTKRKSYSIASPVDEKKFTELCIKIVPGGFVSNWLSERKPGDELDVAGPAGLFVLQDKIDQGMIFAATGTGISSIRPMIFEATKRWGVRSGSARSGPPIILFFGMKSWDEVVYKEDFLDLQRQYKNFKFVPCLSREERPDSYHGYVQDAIPKFVEDLKGKDIYICGVAMMVQQTLQAASAWGMPKEKIHFEKYV